MSNVERPTKKIKYSPGIWRSDAEMNRTYDAWNREAAARLIAGGNPSYLALAHRLIAAIGSNHAEQSHLRNAEEAA